MTKLIKFVYNIYMNRNTYMSTEQISKYHPDKVCDQISDAIVTEYLKKDKNAHIACECMVKGSKVILAGEITSEVEVDRKAIARDVMSSLNYDVERVFDYVTMQSPEINNAVVSDENIGAGDQGIMFGYATDETPSYLPYGFDLANRVISLIEDDVEDNPNTILKGDTKTQIVSCGTEVAEILLSACHKEGFGLNEVQDYLTNLLKSDSYISEICEGSSVRLILNPSGVWTFGGPAADCGLTGRKIICDSYGGYAPVGGGAFSGKDPTKVDRSGAYMARTIACHMVSEGYSECNVQLGYGIGLAEPRSVSIKAKYKSFIGGEKWVDLSKRASDYDLTPRGIINYLDLTNANYREISAGCHMKYFVGQEEIPNK